MLTMAMASRIRRNRRDNSMARPSLDVGAHASIIEDAMLWLRRGRRSVRRAAK